MKLTLKAIISRQDKARATNDNRKRVTKIVASYIGADGHEYRKTFEAYGEPIVPASGDNEEITAMRIQH